MPIQKPTPEQQQKVDEHWRKVREGLYTSEPKSDWGTCKSVVEFHKYRANLLIKEAAKHARKAIELLRGSE